MKGTWKELRKDRKIVFRETRKQEIKKTGFQERWKARLNSIKNAIRLYLQKHNINS
jgi:hypothetical protein